MYQFKLNRDCLTVVLKGICRQDPNEVLGKRWAIEFDGATMFNQLVDGSEFFGKADGIGEFVNGSIMTVVSGQRLLERSALVNWHEETVIHRLSNEVAIGYDTTFILDGDMAVETVSESLRGILKNLGFDIASRQVQ